MQPISMPTPPRAESRISGSSLRLSGTRSRQTNTEVRYCPSLHSKRRSILRRKRWDRISLKECYELFSIAIVSKAYEIVHFRYPNSSRRWRLMSWIIWGKIKLNDSFFGILPLLGGKISPARMHWTKCFNQRRIPSGCRVLETAPMIIFWIGALNLFETSTSNISDDRRPMVFLQSERCNLL